MARVRLFVFLLTIVFVGVVGYLVSLFARGYRADLKRLNILPTGLLVATSVPDGAQILINGELESATNATISLPPNSYDIEVRKEGFFSWKNRLTIKKEEVTKIDTILFPVAPSLSSITFTGAKGPILSPDGTKIAYGVGSNNGNLSKNALEEKTGLWIMELADLPVGFSREPRLITDTNIDDSTWTWSPDSRQIFLTSAKGKYLLNAGETTVQAKLVNISGKQLEEILLKWKGQEDQKKDSRLSKVPEELKDFLVNKTALLIFSPDGKKLFYTASGSKRLSGELVSPIPGSSTQQQQRDIKTGQTYVYDIKEDRNYLIASLPLGQNSRISWFPTSNHLVLAEESKITIMDYDGTNKQAVWSGPYEAPYAIPYPNTTRLLILTSLGSGNGGAPNLYALSLR